MFVRSNAKMTFCVLAMFFVGCTNSVGTKPDTAKPAGDDSVTTGTAPAGGVDEGAKWADHTQQLSFVIGYEKGLAEAKAQDKPLMLFVTTTWCGWCKKHAEENFNDASVKDLLDQFVLVIVDGDTEPDALTKLGATNGFPHLIFQTVSGEKLGEQVGYAPVDEFKKVVEDALAKAHSA